MKIERSLIPQDVLQICEVLSPCDSYVVGGVVRDLAASLLKGKNPETDHPRTQDWDIATSCRPEQTTRLLRRARFAVIPIGIEHGTVVAHARNPQGKVDPDRRYEITTFRFDRVCDGRYARVEFTDSLREDLARRDFTFNALAIHPDDGEVIDLFGGLQDLRDRIVRCVGEPKQRFDEDYLRLLRAIRFAVAIDGEIEAESWEAIREKASHIRQISAERVREELMKMLAYPCPSKGFRLMHESGLLCEILPEFDRCFGVEQNQYHADDVAEHTLLSVDAASPHDPLLRFALLLHDVGKPLTKTYMDDRGDYVFYNHEVVGERVARKAMRRLRFSSKEIERVCLLIRTHMYGIQPDMTKKAVRRWMNRIGRENMRDFIRFRMADRLGNRYHTCGLEPGLYNFIRMMRQVERDQDALDLSDLEISGHDLIAMGMQPGPQMGKVLDRLMELVLDDPEMNRREVLLEQASELISSNCLES